jgi:hypothetical protein
MAEQYYCVGDIYYGGAKGTHTYKHGEPFPADVATDEQIAELRAVGSLKTAAELAAPESNLADIIAAKDAELDALRAALAEANGSKAPKSRKSPEELATEVQ